MFGILFLANGILFTAIPYSGQDFETELMGKFVFGICGIAAGGGFLAGGLICNNISSDNYIKAKDAYNKHLLESLDLKEADLSLNYMPGGARLSLNYRF